LVLQSLLQKLVECSELTWDRHGRDRTVVGFPTTCAFSAYHH